MSESSRYINPPIWEMGLSVRTEKPEVFDLFEIKDLHAEFSEQYPKVARQSDVVGLEIGDINSPSVAFGLQVPLTRWWFLSPDSHSLLQFQENFVARNWRALSMAASERNYPGYETLKTEFEATVATVTAWHERHGRSMPTPAISEVLYDNLIPMLRPDGTVMKTSEVLWPLSQLPDQPKVGLNLGWQQHMKGQDQHEPPAIQIAAAVVGVMVEGQVKPFVKLTFAIRGQPKTWPEVLGFFDRAHTEVHTLLPQMITEECRAQW
jgi:uncharacterized protein (TIGR04255 family)